jgi:very-short-patch-repair endonuclease
MISSESNPKLNIDGTVKGCEYEECTNIQIVKYPPLIEEEIEQIIKERYDYKDEKTKTFIRKALRKHGDRYDYSDVVYIKSDEKVEIICRVEGHKPFPQTPLHHLNGEGCQRCKKNKGEESVRRFLTEKGIEFEEQKTFEGCEYKRQLKFDFYLPKYNLCIESDGNVHSDKINWNGKLTNEQMEEKLKLNQHRDNIKNEYCKNNEIGLLRVNNRKAYEELTNYFNKNIYKTCFLNQ